MPSALIVDDEEDVRFLIRSIIEQANHGLTVAGEAANGQEALEHVAASRPEVIVLDNRMPDGSGLEVAAQILRNHPGQPIILFSAHLDSETVRQATELGIRACLVKNDFSLIPDAIWEHARHGSA